MPRDFRVTQKEVSRNRFWQLQNILESGLLGPITISSGAGVVAYILTNSGETALRVVGGVYFVAVWLNQRIKKARKKHE